MGVSLNELEKSWRRDVRAAAGQPDEAAVLWRDSLRYGAAAAVVGPFAVCVGIFVPFLGQVLVLALVLLSLVLLWVRRSLIFTAVFLAGVAIGLAAIVALASIYGTTAAPVYYLLVTFSVFMSGVGVVALMGAIWLHFEKGRVRHETRMREGNLGEQGR